MQGKKWMERICRRYSEILGEQLTGIYLHGSAAFGCACDASDLDFIVVVSGAPSQQQKREMIALLLCLSREPDAPGKGFEMSVVEQTVCRPFCYPTPYLLHYSQSYQKQFAEDLDGWCRRMNGVDVRIIRIFNTYGPRMNPNDGRVVSNFIVQALKGEDITIYGTGKQTRSFQYVDDLVEGMVRMMDTEGFSGPVNLGNPEEFTMLELAEKVIEMTGSSSKTVFRPLPLDDPTQRKPDIRLAKEKLGWKPHITLEKGLEKTIAYFRSIL